MTGSGVTAELEPRWRALWRRAGGNGDGQAQFVTLMARYAEPARSYHTLEHIADCLGELDREQAAAERFDEAELALWFHDIVYDPRAGGNEARSAELATRLLGDTHLGADALARISGMILATDHVAPPPRGDAELVCDADLAILGASADRYARYVRQVSEEYAWVPAPIFRRERAAVLRRLLGRRWIYATPGFRERCEAAARRNLGAELAELER